MALRLSPASAIPVMASLGIVAVLAATPLQAQRGSASTDLIFGAGLSLAGGDTVTSGGLGLAGHIGLRYRTHGLVLSVRAGTNFGGSDPTVRIAGGLRDRFDELAATVGYVVHDQDDSRIILSTGLASVSGERVGTGPEPGFGKANVPFTATLGVPVQIDMTKLGGNPNLGLTVQGNVNSEEVFGAVTATYAIGLGGSP